MNNIIAAINITDIFYNVIDIYSSVFGSRGMFFAFVLGAISFAFFLDKKNYPATMASLIITYAFMSPLLISVHPVLWIFGLVVALIITSLLYHSWVVKRAV